MNNTLQTIIVSGITAAGAIALALTLGFGKHTAETVYMEDGTNVQQLLAAMNTKLDVVTGVLSDAINTGTKRVRTDIIDQANEGYRQETARIKAESEAAQQLAANARKAVRKNPAGVLLGGN